MGYFVKQPYDLLYLDFATQLEPDLWYYGYKHQCDYNDTWGHRTPKEKRIIMVLSDGFHTYDEIVGQSFMRYSCKFNLPLHIIRDYEGVNKQIHWEKHRVVDWLKKGYRVLYLDHDTYITKACPNLFEVVPPEYFGALDESIHYWSRYCVDHRIYSAEIGRMLGKPLPPEYEVSNCSYWQAGVWVAGPQHVPVFTLPQDPKERELLHDWPLSDQSWMNYALAYNKVKCYPLVKQANMMRPEPGDFPWIIHAAGISEKDRHNWLAEWDGQ